jgi:hypothetical protein
MHSNRTLTSAIVLSALIAGISPAAAQSRSESLENLSAIAASPPICGFKVNETIVTMAVNSLFDSPADVSPGGKYWPDIQRNMRRIHALTSTEPGRQSFCNRVRTNLSAFFD